MAIHHSADDWTVGQRQRNPGFAIFVEVRVLVSKRFLRARFQRLNKNIQVRLGFITSNNFWDKL